MALCLHFLVPHYALIAQSEPGPGTPSGDAQAKTNFVSRYVNQYREKELPTLVLDNTPRLDNLIHDGKLELTLADALALALENSLDIATQRYLPAFAQTDVLRTESGQAARGFTGASIPGGLSAGALGVGVSASGTGSGVGNAGGITGGGGAVQVGPTGNFDPAVSFNFSWDRATSPLNTIQVSGVPNVTGQVTAFSGTYAQLFHQGASYSLSMSGQRQSSTQQFLRFNPAVATRFALGFNQPLLNSFGRLPNERFIRVAKNNLKVADEVFTQQIITTVVQVENTYWDLAALQENVRVAEQSLAVAQQLFKDNQIRLEIGTMSPLDVTSAESEVAARTRDLTLAQTNVQMQETTLKSLLTKRFTPALDAARIVLLDRMPEPRDSDLPDLQSALAAAMKNRPDLRQIEHNLQNQDIAVRHTSNALLPGANVFGFYAGSGLQGDTVDIDTGAGDALLQSFKGNFPEYAGGITLSIPFRNRLAQADNLRSQFELKQMQTDYQSSRNQVALEVRKAIIGLIQGKAQVAAAHEAVRLAREIYEGERNRLDAGVSTSYQVILRERDLIAARQADVVAVAGYSKAMVEMDRAMGATLDRNGIEYADALSGTVTKMPATPFSAREPKPEVK
jgi:outer membrane protein TolC